MPCPLIGCGFYTGPVCAIASTGIGEEIIRMMLSKTVYDMVSQGEDIRRACERGIDMFPSETKVGIIGISREGFAALSNTGMEHYSLVKHK